MNKKLVIGIIVIIVVFVIAAAILGVILRNPLYLVNLLTIWIPLEVWIYLVWMVWKKKTNLAEGRLKMLKVFLLVAGISLAVGIVGVILHNALYGLFEKEEPVSFFIAIVALYLFIIATIGGLLIFLKGRREWAREIWERLAK